jgi:NADH-quinone oxidoreductase subunit H
MILITSTIFGVIVIAATLGAVTFLILIERKVAAYIQDRIGPNRVGPRGLLQTVADAIKLLFKEDFIPAEADKFLFFLGPSLVMLSAMLIMAAIPFGGRWQIDGWKQSIPLQIVPGLDVGIVYVVTVAIGAVYGVLLGGWASNNKYAFFGSLRAVAQILSYEIPLGVCLLCVFLLVSDLRLETVVHRQMETGWHWLVFYQPAVFFIMLVTVFAETNRLPFDTPEAEQEIVAGYHTEFSSMEFGMYFLGEYAHLIASSALLVTLFLGGWHFPGLTPDVVGGLGQTILKLFVFSVKTVVMILIFMWARWTLPRFRFDQILRLGWTGLLPLSLILLAITGVFTYFGLAWTVWMTLANIGVLAGALAWSWLAEQRSTPPTRVAPLPSAESPKTPMEATGPC